MINIIKELLLEFDPRKSVTGGPKDSSPETNKAIAAGAEEFDRGKKGIKNIKKVTFRQLARGSKATKTSGPKGKLPEAIQQAILEFDPKKEKKEKLKDISPQSNSSTKAFLAGVEQENRNKNVFLGLKRLNKTAARALARGGAGDRSTNSTKEKKLSGPKRKLPEAIQQALLEFDPKKGDRKLFSGDADDERSPERKTRIAAFNQELRKSRASDKKKTAMKTGNRAFARGGKSKKEAGPKGKLPEALEQALLEFDPRKDTAKNRQGFAGRDRERSASGKRIVKKSIATQQSTEKARNKSANRAGSRSIGLGDKLGRKRKFSEAIQQALLEVDPKKIRKDTARDIRSINKRIKAKLGN